MILNLCVDNFVFGMVVVFQINIKKFAIMGDKNKKNMNAWWQKMFDLFVVGDYYST